MEKFAQEGEERNLIGVEAVKWEQLRIFISGEERAAERKKEIGGRHRKRG